MDNFSSSKEHRGFDWAAFISGILMVIAAILLIRHPGVGLRAFVLIFAILSIVQGFVWFAVYSHFRDLMSYGWVTILAGILDIIVGILFLYSYDVAGLALAYLFAIWFFVDSIAGMVFAWHLRKFSTFYFVFDLILDILSLLISIALMFNPALSALTLVMLIAVWLIIFGIDLQFLYQEFFHQNEGVSMPIRLTPQFQTEVSTPLVGP